MPAGTDARFSSTFENLLKKTLALSSPPPSKPGKPAKQCLAHFKLICTILKALASNQAQHWGIYIFLGGFPSMSKFNNP